ncbi:hypothetical protein [Metabacillus arenae]|uniref:Uncharacterized protein n=1 Tax=Metabacillus arenae TaxID=2771434 RepID=A0A926NEZ8_9BACI|nr:hypothetical protein [Metabacillus arenae]MBD1379870.1 hypothetical protein [Metabacillus arenae]
MRVPVYELKEGCILSEDVILKTNRPLLLKEAVLNKELLQILSVFLIKDVDVKPKLVNGIDFRAFKTTLSNVESHEADVKPSEIINELDIEHFYVEAVSAYKKMFLSWRGGHLSILEK